MTCPPAFRRGCEYRAGTGGKAKRIMGYYSWGCPGKNFKASLTLAALPGTETFAEPGENRHFL